MPLVRQMFEDSSFALVPLALDHRWLYEKVSSPVASFNPFSGKGYYGARSALASWLGEPFGSARRYNEQDLLVSELMFAVHDYLHAWACNAVRELAPRLGFGTAPITRANVEDLVFAHLLTESVATVGLDYWYLSTLDLNDVCDLGSAIVGGLTVSYHERDAAEYRRFFPELDVQSKEFFTDHALFYCSGAFLGFAVDDLRQSPRLHRWLRHELAYGTTQRRYIRSWLAFLSDEIDALPLSSLGAPVEVRASWKKSLVRDVGALLWEKVKEGKLHRFSSGIPDGESWKSDPARRPDFRFVSVHHVDVDALTDDDFHAPESFNYFLRQFVLTHELGAFRRAEPKKWIKAVTEARSVSLLREAFAGVPRVSSPARGPRDLFVLP